VSLADQPSHVERAGAGHGCGVSHGETAGLTTSSPVSDPRDTNSNYVIASNALEVPRQLTPDDLQFAQVCATLAIVEELARLTDAVERLAGDD
jgi:hypothetical protein